MTIQDLAGNPLVTQSSGMVGFVPVSIEDSLSLRMYPFIVESIREEDQQRGSRFVERFLDGPQSVWETIDARIKSLPSLWSVVDIESEYLQYLKWIVGWTSELDNITDDLDDATLRRLIDSSVPFWKKRGVEDAIADILSLTTGARLRIWNWFDLRMVMGELVLGESLQGFDPLMLSLPGPPDDDENRMNVRIVDDGTLDRKLVRNLVRLARPGGERITISYIGFLDQFAVDGDRSQWADNGGGELVVANGSMSMPTLATEAYVSASGSDDWSNYIFFMRLRDESTIVFYRTASTDHYSVHFDPASNEISLQRTIAGSLSTLQTINMFTELEVTLQADVFYTIRVRSISLMGGASILVYFEGNEIISFGAETSHIKGTIGVIAGNGVTEIDQAELFFVPMDEDFIEIN